MKKTPLAKQSKSKTATLQRACDKMLTPIIKKQHPTCLLLGFSDKCTKDTQVAHHHVHKSKSTLLRYDFDNLIPLCHHCHLMLHHNESYWASKIVQIKGISWFKELDIKKHQTVKADVIWYMQTRKRLEEMLN